MDVKISTKFVQVILMVLQAILSVEYHNVNHTTLILRLVFLFE